MSSNPVLGFIGLGAMGSQMVVHLLRAGYTVYGFDLNPGRLEAAVAAGVARTHSISELVAQVDIILTSLPSSQAFVHMAEYELHPHVRSGQTVIDFGTVTPPETRRLAARFAEKEVTFIDAPVSGGPTGATAARLYMFVGGDPAVVERCHPILTVVGGRERMTYCGPAGSGQVVKGVNQLMLGLVEAANLEAIAFGVNAGVDPATIAKAIGFEGRFRADFSNLARQVAEGKGNEAGVKFRELPYFLREAQEKGFPLPLTSTLYAFCAAGNRVVIDDNRPAPSFYRQLTEREDQVSQPS
jgi:2-hydroxy-3-oxopropionate reductase